MNAIAKRENWRIIGVMVAAIAVVALVWFLMGRLFPDNKLGPTKNEKTADSLDATRPADKALIDSSAARIAVRGAATLQAEAASRDAQNRANRNRARADSLAQVAIQAADSARAWHAAYDARTTETVDLRNQGVEDAKVIANLKADTTELRQQLGVVNRRLATTEAVVVGLRWDLEQARQCKILGLVNCPSRIQTAGLVLVGKAALDALRNRKN